MTRFVRYVQTKKLESCRSVESMTIMRVRYKLLGLRLCPNKYHMLKERTPPTETTLSPGHTSTHPPCKPWDVEVRRLRGLSSRLGVRSRPVRSGTSSLQWSRRRPERTVTRDTDPSTTNSLSTKTTTPSGWTTEVTSFTEERRPTVTPLGDSGSVTRNVE